MELRMKKKIVYRFFIFVLFFIVSASRMSYTDGDKIHFSNQGVPMVLVSIPLRYMHTPAEMADLKDVQDCIDLIAEFLVEQSR